MTSSIKGLFATLCIMTFRINYIQHNSTSAIMLNVIMLKVAFFTVMLSVIMLSVVMLNVVMLGVVAPFQPSVI